MIDKFTFTIILLKFFAIQIIFAGIIIGISFRWPIYEVLICLGSLLFAIISNFTLFIGIRKLKR
jgi:hypothetical protein